MQQVSTKLKNALSHLFVRNRALLILMVAVALFSVLDPWFLTGDNLSNLLLQNAVLAVLALGLCVAIISGSIDLSVGSVASLSCVFTAMAVVHWGWPVGAACLGSILLGGLIGLFNGWCVTVFQMNSMIVTFLTMNVVQGLAYILCEGNPVYGLPVGFSLLRSTEWMGLPVLFFLPLLLGVLLQVLFLYSYWGKYLYAVGANAKSAGLAGVNVSFVRILAFVTSGVVAGMAGVLICTRINGGVPNAGRGLEFSAVVVVMLSGIPIAGGRGRPLGILAGVLTYGVITSGLIMLRLNVYVQDVVMGVLVFLAAFYESIAARWERSGRRAATGSGEQ